MKHYYNQKIELQIAKQRLKGLKERKKLLFFTTQPKTIDTTNGIIQSNKSTNVFDDYVCNIKEIEEKIDLVEKDIAILQNYLNAMERGLRQIKGPLERIFVLRHIDGLTISEIQQRTYYSKSSIYRKLAIISKILKCEKK